MLQSRSIAIDRPRRKLAYCLIKRCPLSSRPKMLLQLAFNRRSGTRINSGKPTAMGPNIHSEIP